MADNGDTMYPTKCTRANRTPPVVPSDGGSPGNGGADAADVDGSEEGIKAPKRRSTCLHTTAQAKPSPVWRNSSKSDRMQTSISVSIVGGQLRKEDIDSTLPNTTVRSSAASSRQPDVAKTALEESPVQGAQMGVLTQAKALEAPTDRDEAPGGAEDSLLGASVVDISQNPEGGKPDKESGPRSPLS